MGGLADPVRESIYCTYCIKSMTIDVVRCEKFYWFADSKHYGEG